MSQLQWLHRHINTETESCGYYCIFGESHSRLCPKKNSSALLHTTTANGRECVSAIHCAPISHRGVSINIVWKYKQQKAQFSLFFSWAIRRLHRLRSTLPSHPMFFFVYFFFYHFAASECKLCVRSVYVFSISVVYTLAVRRSVNAFFCLARVWRLNVYAAFFLSSFIVCFFSSSSVFSLFLIVYFSHLLSTLYLSSIGHDIEFSSIFNDFIRQRPTTNSRTQTHSHTTQSTTENLRYFRLAAIFQSAAASSKWMAPFNGAVVVCCCCVFSI